MAETQLAPRHRQLASRRTAARIARRQLDVGLGAEIHIRFGHRGRGLGGLLCAERAFVALAGRTSLAP